MKLEWSDRALADLDRFAQHLHRENPLRAQRVAAEIISKVQVLSDILNWDDQSQAGKSIARLCSKSPAQLTCFNIALTVAGWSCCGFSMREKRATEGAAQAG
jgi:hypothetical protein